eukprot:33958-Pelagomonas_calceolata.AAC.2
MQCITAPRWELLCVAVCWVIRDKQGGGGSGVSESSNIPCLNLSTVLHKQGGVWWWGGTRPGIRTKQGHGAGCDQAKMSLGRMRLGGQRGGSDNSTNQQELSICIVKARRTSSRMARGG